MELSRVASVTLAPAPHLHGSWFTDSSTPHAGGLRASILLCVTVCTQAMAASADAKPGATATFPLFEKERPLASTVKEWIEQSESLLPADQRSLVDGRRPRTLLQYRPATVRYVSIEITFFSLASQFLKRPVKSSARQPISTTECERY